jgi:hypothetical protein
MMPAPQMAPSSYRLEDPYGSSSAYAMMPSSKPGGEAPAHSAPLAPGQMHGAPPAADYAYGAAPPHPSMPMGVSYPVPGAAQERRSYGGATGSGHALAMMPGYGVPGSAPHAHPTPQPHMDMGSAIGASSSMGSHSSTPAPALAPGSDQMRMAGDADLGADAQLDMEPTPIDQIGLADDEDFSDIAQLMFSEVRCAAACGRAP